MCSRVSVRRSSVYGWDGYVLSCGDITAGLAPSLGGRIISLKFRDEELLFVHPKYRGITFPTEAQAEMALQDLKRKMKESFGFPIWGGDKTWLAPQSSWVEGIPPLDLDAGRYTAEATDNAVIMTSPVCRETNLQITRRVSIDNSAEIMLEETITNRGTAPASWSIWNVTQILRPFDLFIPVPKEALRPCRDIEGSEERLSRVVQQKEGWVRVAMKEAGEFKFGSLPANGKIVASRKLGEQRLVWSRTFDTDPSSAYAHESSVEVFNSPTDEHPYFELEIHAPAAKLEAGQSRSQRQRWQLSAHAQRQPIA